MPPRTRRKAQATPAAQTTLSFKNRVTKANAADHVTAKKSSKLSETLEPEIDTIVNIAPQAERASIPAVTKDEVLDQEEEQPSEPIAVASPTPRKKKRVSTASSQSDPREAAASKVSDAQLKKYWKAEEESRLAPRVHQKDVSLHEKILRHFDLSSQYGPCIGIPRLQRWKRANTLGLDPPIEVMAVLQREAEGSSAKGRAQGCGQLSYFDELAGGRVGLVEG